ncbi:NAD(P)/FAD-dependent oxidoreductase [Pararhodobacter oceanensis]|uniref:Pyridine nucleotide-disulfide oxidoreductase n=1 Tax=Pararhodobacter oceanensis TaxID=2172121 RepID=A0A2T8HUZ1_9RHOB|nr:FAD/NAD(P)-binding oxidoreductase [Pararhodobacter oceanensis]PVH29251.1 pyridine nucleotide-disulfide oxidoreductase [Pararhodobacter oceanensis]
MAGIVVIGAGQAGSSLVVKLRALGYAGDVTLVGDEPVPPYQRPPLSKSYLLGKMDLDRLFLRPQAFYDDQNITLRLNTKVSRIDAAAKTVWLGDEALPYDQLALTTGAEPRQLPAAIGGDLAGVYAVRRLSDIDAMAAEFTEGRRVLIIGGGYIGLEAAAVAAQKGLNVTLIEAAPRILGRVASPETADVMRALHQSHGVTIREGLGLTRLTGDSRVQAAELADGSVLEVDFVIVGIGISPAADLAQAAGVTLENGIAVDDFGRTSDPSIWAAGDCASFTYQGTRLRLESVQNAIDQAEAVAENMLAADKAYAPMPWFWSDQYDMKLQIAGLNSGYDRIVTRETGTARSHWYFREGQFISVDAMNDPRAYMVGKRLLEQGKTPAAEAVADPDTELKALLK